VPRPHLLDLTDQSGVSNLNRVDRRSPNATDYLLGIKRASNTVAGKYARCSVTMDGPGHHTCHTWPALGFTLACPVHPGYPPCGWPRTLYLPLSQLLHHCSVMLCCVMSCCVIIASSPCCVTSSLCHCHHCIVTMLLCHVASLWCHCHHCIVAVSYHVIVIIISLSSLRCCCCHIVAVIMW